MTNLSHILYNFYSVQHENRLEISYIIQMRLQDKDANFSSININKILLLFREVLLASMVPAFNNVAYLARKRV